MGMAIATKPKHIETGVIKCGSNTKWEGKNGSTYWTNMTQAFNSSYEEPPVVHLSVAKLEDWVYNTRFKVELIQVDNDKFMVRCCTWLDTQVQDIWVSWISFPN